MALLVPIPIILQDGNPATTLASEKPFTLSCGPVTFADGTSLGPTSATAFNYLMYRQLSGGNSEVWDASGKSWKVAGSSVKAQPLAWIKPSWQSLLVAIGNLDNVQQPVFLTDPTSGFPQYSAQCFFTGTDSNGAAQTGQSPLTAPVTVLPPGQQNRADIAITPPDPKQANDILISLKDSTLVEQGHVRIFQIGSGFQVELFSGGASVVVSNNGAITLSPAGGQPVTVNGQLDVSGPVFSGGIQLV
jgi:hypothetical protein